MVVNVLADVSRESARLETASPEEILAWVLGRFGRDFALSLGAGVEGTVLLDMALRVDPGVRAFTIDTGLLFRQTQEHLARVEAQYAIAIQVFEPAETVGAQEAAAGARLWERDPDACCARRKVEPNQRALSGLGAWGSALRRDQSTARARIQILEELHIDGRTLIKVHPLANWTRADVWRYVHEHAVPYNELLDQGFTSVGCVPCTRPTRVGESERAGRWAGSGKTECGIHTVPLRRSAAR